MGLLGWDTGPDFPAGLARLGLHSTPHTRWCFLVIQKRIQKKHTGHGHGKP